MESTPQSPRRDCSEQSVEPKTPIGIGNFYRDKTTGLQWMLAGYRSGYRVCLIRDADGADGDVRDEVPIPVIETDYEFVDCNHDHYCCTIHSTHATPHRGCLMR